MKPVKRKSDCPWTSTRKRKKQRKTTESISEHKKTRLAQSDKGSWFDQVKWLEEEESNASVSARKLNHFITFCLMQGIIGPSFNLLPAFEITLIYFAAHLAKTICYNTIKLYLFAVQDLHRQHNFPLKLSKMYRLQKVLTGIKRSQMPPKLNRHPITIQILDSIYSYFQPPLS